MLTNVIFGNDLKIFVEMQTDKSDGNCQKRTEITQKTLKFHKMTLENSNLGKKQTEIKVIHRRYQCPVHTKKIYRDSEKFGKKLAVVKSHNYNAKKGTR